MKLTSTILKLIAVLLAAFAVVCLVMANLERITRCVDAVSARLQAKKEALRRACPCSACEMEDEFEDWDLQNWNTRRPRSPSGGLAGAASPPRLLCVCLKTSARGVWGAGRWGPSS